jgi:hypothetical protein
MTTTNRLPRRQCGLVVAACAAGLIGAAVPAAAATPLPAVAAGATVSWSVAPSTANGPDRRTHFSYSGIKPNTVVHDYVGITNYSTRPVTFRVYASDGITTIAGSIGLAPTKQRPVDIGAWVRTEHRSVTVPPRGRVNEPFTLSVPADATPGDHVGGVIASVTQARRSGKVARDDRIGVALYLRVAGPLHPALGIESVGTTGYHGTLNPFGTGSTSVSYTVHNTGNVRLGGTQTVTVTGPFGATLATVHPPALEEVLPGGSVRVTAHLPRVFPAGSLDVHVRVVPAPVPGSPHLAVGPQPTLYTVGLWATPWPQLALLILLACAVFGVLRWRRRRRQRLAGALAAAVERGRREAEEQLAGVGADQHGAPDPE